MLLNAIKHETVAPIEKKIANHASAVFQPSTSEGTSETEAAGANAALNGAAAALGGTARRSGHRAPVRPSARHQAAPLLPPDPQDGSRPPGPALRPRLRLPSHLPNMEPS